MWHFWITFVTFVSHSSVSIVKFEQVNADWVVSQCDTVMLRHFCLTHWKCDTSVSQSDTLWHFCQCDFFIVTLDILLDIENICYYMGNLGLWGFYILWRLMRLRIYQRACLAKAPSVKTTDFVPKHHIFSLS